MSPHACDKCGSREASSQRRPLLARHYHDRKRGGAANDACEPTFEAGRCHEGDEEIAWSQLEEPCQATTLLHQSAREKASRSQSIADNPQHADRRERVPLRHGRRASC